jgi:hypothetical protein
MQDGLAPCCTSSLIRSMENIERWTKHSPMSDPAGHAGAVAELPFDIAALNGIIQGLLVHCDWLTAYGLDSADYQSVSRNTLPVADRLDAIRASDPRDLRTPRPAGRRTVGTCRDFALMLFLSAQQRRLLAGALRLCRLFRHVLGRSLGLRILGWARPQIAVERCANGRRDRRKMPHQLRSDRRAAPRVHDGGRGVAGLSPWAARPQSFRARHRDWYVVHQDQCIPRPLRSERP